MSANARVVGVDRECPLVREPSGRLVRIQANGRVVAATTMASRKVSGTPKRRGVAVAESYRQVWS